MIIEVIGFDFYKNLVDLVIIFVLLLKTNKVQKDVATRERQDVSFKINTKIEYKLLVTYFKDP
jgi:hypothetical protein